MTDSLELYKKAVHLATNSPLGTKTYAENEDRLKNYYLQLVTTTYYELTTQKTSPIISALCRVEKISFAPKNFNLSPAQAVFNHHTNFDLYLTVHGLNVALTGNLAACQKLYEQNATKIFRKFEEDVQELLNQLTALDAGIGKFFAAERVVERIVEKRVEVPVERVVERVRAGRGQVESHRLHSRARRCRHFLFQRARCRRQEDDFGLRFGRRHLRRCDYPRRQKRPRVVHRH